jgi:3-methyladenine DNA glycosylase AlkC
MERVTSIGALLFAAIRDRPDREAVFEALASHPSDMVRVWTAFALAADADLPLPRRLEASRRFATDRNRSVRECAWSGFRAYVARGLDERLRLLEPWVHNPDENIRRCAIEGMRPRGVWTAHIPALAQAPERAMVLLEPVRSDTARYVQNAVANWLNDASKSRPDWVRGVCERWTEESPTRETAWIVNRGLRTLRKRGA